MRTSPLACVLCSICLLSPGTLLGGDDLSSYRRGSLEKWMVSSGIFGNFEIVRIGSGPHPASEPSKEMPPVLHLELRFIDEGSSQAAESARFQQVLAAYQVKHGATLPEKIFYEFIQTFAVGRREASVDFHVLEDQYSVYVSPKTSELIVGEDESRGDPRHFSVAIPVAVPKEQFRARGPAASAGSAQQVRDSVEDILKTYFLDANQSKGLPKPDITPVREDGYLGLKVGSIKGLVTDRYWEWVSINIEISRDPAESSPQPPLWKIGCYVAVKYASSPNEKSPADADGDYPSQVVRLRDKLVDQLQQKLEKGNHD
jgi:hypothetical protein